MANHGAGRVRVYPPGTLISITEYPQDFDHDFRVGTDTSHR